MNSNVSQIFIEFSPYMANILKAVQGIFVFKVSFDMNIKLYQIDAFTDQVFSGNPAAVCPLEEWFPGRVSMSCAGLLRQQKLTCVVMLLWPLPM